MSNVDNVFFKYASLIKQMNVYRNETRHGQAHRLKWQRAINAFAHDISTERPSLVMKSEEAEIYASKLWGRKRWEPVAAAIKEMEDARTADSRAAIDETVSHVAEKPKYKLPSGATAKPYDWVKGETKDPYITIAANPTYAESKTMVDEKAQRDITTQQVRAKGVATQDVSQAEIDSYIILEQELKAEIAQYKATITSLKTEVASLKQRPFNSGAFATKIAELKSDNDRLENKVRALEQRPTLAHYQKLQKQLGNDEKLRPGSPEWRHEQILKQVNNLPIWSLAEAKKYYNSIGKREYSMPTHTRKGLFWMDFTTDDAGNEVQTEKPIAWFGFMGEIIDLQRKNNEKDLEIQKLYNQIYDSKDGAANIKLQSEIKHLKIQLAEAKDGYVDINNIPFDTAVQVLAKGAFPEPAKGKGFNPAKLDATDIAHLQAYNDDLRGADSVCNSISPIFGDKLRPSAICKRHGIKINQWGQPIFGKDHGPALVSFIEFCRAMDTAMDNTVQNLQATKYAVDKIIREAGQ